jgi:uncharacterized protein
MTQGYDRRFATRAPAHAVPSPCVSVCQMDQASGRCRGCQRTLDEIAQWSTASDATKWDILRRLSARQMPAPKEGT